MDKSGFLKMGALIAFLSILFFPSGAKFIPHFVALGLILGVWWFIKLG